MAQDQTPSRRSRRVIVSEVYPDLVVVERDSGNAYCLSGIDVVVWRAGDGTLTADGIAAQTGAAEADVAASLRRLGDAGLLAGTVSRRIVLRTAGMGGVAAGAAGLAGIIVPTPAMAASVGGGGAGGGTTTPTGTAPSIGPGYSNSIDGAYFTVTVTGSATYDTTGGAPVTRLLVSVTGAGFPADSAGTVNVTISSGADAQGAAARDVGSFGDLVLRASEAAPALTASVSQTTVGVNVFADDIGAFSAQTGVNVPDPSGTLTGAGSFTTPSASTVGPFTSAPASFTAPAVPAPSLVLTLKGPTRYNGPYNYVSVNADGSGFIPGDNIFVGLSDGGGPSTYSEVTVNPDGTLPTTNLGVPTSQTSGSIVGGAGPDLSTTFTTATPLPFALPLIAITQASPLTAESTDLRLTVQLSGFPADDIVEIRSSTNGVQVSYGDVTTDGSGNYPGASGSPLSIDIPTSTLFPGSNTVVISAVEVSDSTQLSTQSITITNPIV